MEHRRPAAYAQEMNGDGNEAGTAEDPGEAATVPLDLLLTAAATGMLRRLNPAAAGLRLGAGPAAQPGRRVPAPGLARQPAATPHGPGLPGRGGERGGRGGRRRPGRGRRGT